MSDNTFSRPADLSSCDTTVCLTCGEDDQPQLYLVTSLNDTMCTGCIKKLFSDALSFEAKYPVPFGMKITDFSDFLSDEFVHRFLQREREYRTVDRVHCLNRLLSTDAPPPGSSAPQDVSLTAASLAAAISTGEEVELCNAVACERHEEQNTVDCYRCRGRLCGRCGTAQHPGVQQHECKIDKIDAASVESRLGQVVGRDIQFCPNTACKKGWNLLEACNHMVCPSCDTNFCFLCGEEAAADSGHWSMHADHPRFGQPGNSNAVFDDEIQAEAEAGGQFDDDGDENEWENNDEDEPLIMVEQYQTPNGLSWFETFISLGRILEEIEDAMGLNPEFLPVLQGHVSTMAITICFQGDLDGLEVMDVTEASIIEVDKAYPVGEAAKDAVRTALTSLDEYLSEDDGAMLVSLLFNALQYQGHDIIPAQRGEATAQTGQTGIRQLEEIPAALENPFGGIRALQRDL